MHCYLVYVRVRIVLRPLAASLKNIAGDEDSTLPRIIFVCMHIAYELLEAAFHRFRILYR